MIFSYDLIELDEYKNRKNRAGCITSFPQLVQKFGNAVGLQVIGIVLAMVGYDAALESQSASAVSGIQNISTVYLAICLAVSIVCIILYPVIKKYMQDFRQQMRDAVQARRILWTLK